MNDIIKYFIDNGYLISPDALEDIHEEDSLIIIDYLKTLKEKPSVINKDLINLIKQNKKFIPLNWNEFDKSRVLFEKNKDKTTYNSFLSVMDPKPMNGFSDLIEVELKENETGYEEQLSNGEESNVIILKNYYAGDKKYEVKDFVNYFKLRYDKIKDLLISRKELQNSTSINRVLNKIDREGTAIIGLVNDKRTTKNGNLILNLEDPTGLINVVVSKNKPELFDLANDTLLDEVIGVTGQVGDKIIFVNGLFYPDIPINNELKKAEKEEYALFTSDMQVGSKVFYEKSFLKFIDWLNGDYGTEEQKNIAKKVKYFLIAGDVVEGVGVHPGQEEDLEIKDIYQQYEKFANYIEKIRKDIKIVICPGNHDAMRIAEPQPIIDKKFSKKLNEMPNVYLITNPALVNIASTNDFQGFNVLFYHGFSFPYIAENVESIRKGGRLENVDLIMKYLLQRRHLAPSHTSTQYLPGNDEDALFIEKIPDFFISGHIHKTKVMNYRNITLMNCSCWVGMTEDQERRGIKPDPCKAILVNLKTREVKILNFMET